MSPQGPYEKYKAKEAERERRLKQDIPPQPMKRWWLGQRDPIARFTAYVAVVTVLLVLVGGLQWCTLNSQLIDDRAAKRATVYTESLTVTEVKDKAFFMVRWKNSGQTSTTITQWVNINNFHTPDGAPPSDFTYPDYDGPHHIAKDHTSASHIFIGPGATAVSNNISIPKFGLDALINKQIRLFAWGWAKYDDIFGEHHGLRFCDEIIAERTGQADPTDVHKTNVYVYFAQYKDNNCTDKGCKGL